jgi:MFS family permease
MGRRQGRSSGWSWATSLGAFACSALIALDRYGWAWRSCLHIAFPLVVFLYSQHLAVARKVAAPVVPELPLTPTAPVVSSKTIEAIPARAYTCPNCDAALTLGAYGAAVRNRYCAGCKHGVVMTTNGKEH